MSSLTVTEILDEIDKLKTKKLKVAQLPEAIKKNPAIKTILAINFNYENAGFVGLDKGIPTGYKPNVGAVPGYADATLFGIYKKLYIYADPKLLPNRKLELFLQDLEALDPDEANILILAKDNNLKYKYPWITEDAFKIVFSV